MSAFFKNLSSPAPSFNLCWELKEIKDSTYKFNKCTGELVKIETITATANTSKK
jgi:hypothetical protein